ncbi:hypothetical protein H257_08230 [Aphanomyces astaci]|uniref:Uncharacterized protein n=1 Tax=Aphanomyces astaci TaxID=112090 RepID=W4GGC0_APHAT|nr:hypothetical protein H257_08230 [Aphanomyces astaci]ETV78013.1 hypothetical protein H257_08230 [Aphanomyces astaci]|eukprot:XP_009832350.1 hypothetical protein H257_08230 [Aphanomyces astaci]
MSLIAWVSHSDSPDTTNASQIVRRVWGLVSRRHPSSWRNVLSVNRVVGLFELAVRCCFLREFTAMTVLSNAHIELQTTATGILTRFDIIPRSVWESFVVARNGFVPDLRQPEEGKAWILSIMAPSLGPVAEVNDLVHQVSGLDLSTQQANATARVATTCTVRYLYPMPTNRHLQDAATLGGSVLCAPCFCSSKSFLRWVHRSRIASPSIECWASRSAHAAASASVRFVRVAVSTLFSILPLFSVSAVCGAMVLEPFAVNRASFLFALVAWGALKPCTSPTTSSCVTIRDACSNVASPFKSCVDNFLPLLRWLATYGDYVAHYEDQTSGDVELWWASHFDE